MGKKSIPVTCPICGRKNTFPLESLVQGSILACPHCGVHLTLHGHMWEEIRSDIEKMTEEDRENS